MLLRSIKILVAMLSVADQRIFSVIAVEFEPLRQAKEQPDCDVLNVH